MIFILIAPHNSANNNSICRNLPIASPSTTTCEFETGLNITKKLVEALSIFLLYVRNIVRTFY